MANYYLHLENFEAYKARVNEKLTLFPVEGGSDKQNKWASELRNAFCEKMLAKLDPDGSAMAEQKEMEKWATQDDINRWNATLESAKKGLMVLTQVVDAKKLIDVRNNLSLKFLAEIETSIRTYNLKLKKAN